MTTRCVIGLASGSSADGVDAALVECEGIGLDLHVRTVFAVCQPYARDLREWLRRISDPRRAEPRSIGLLHRLLGETFAAAARQVADRASRSLQRVQCIGCPGHTLWHESDGRFPFTLPLGMTAVIAERTGVTTVSDFRARDLATGGHGVPLEVLPDYLLFRHGQESRLLIHLGGRARVTLLPAGGRPQDCLGFETGPCTLLLDALMRHFTNGREEFDPGGKHGVQGRCLDALVQRWLAHPYFQRRPPKSIPGSEFTEELLAPALQAARQDSATLHDLLCSATHFVVQSIHHAIERFVPQAGRCDRILVSGGGVRNGLLWHLLEQQFAGRPLEKTNGLGIPAEARKAAGYALLAALTLDGVPANLPGATGATGARLLGNLTPGSSTNWSRCLAWMASQSPPLLEDVA